ncbi:unnamed protein product [Rangifer tarandus platyrhynchus]|uniref:Uncharacterized protein n=1 Tax=Rangifer tarandus platyrhynchus TaxID=3082113 RepID=A0ABN8ZBS1_RANTA|nr:unnamed protein product [Rangifer tarandus platyrhynchus]
MQQSGAPADLQRKLSKNRNKCVISPEGITSEGFNDTVKPFTGTTSSYISHTGSGGGACAVPTSAMEARVLGLRAEAVLQPLPLDVTSRLHILCTDKVLLKRRGKRCTPRSDPVLGLRRVTLSGFAAASADLMRGSPTCFFCQVLNCVESEAPRCAQATVITHLTCCRRPLSRVPTSSLGPLHLLVTLLDKRPFKMQADHITACFHGSHCSQMKDLAWTLISLLAVVRTTACSHVVISILLLPKALLPSTPKFG